GAAADFDEALRMDKTHADALCGRATALMRGGRVAEAEAAADTGLSSLKPEQRTPDRLVRFATVYALALNQPGARDRAYQNQEHALDLLQEVLDRLPDDNARRSFWQGRVETADGLAPLHSTTRYKKMAGFFGSK